MRGFPKHINTKEDVAILQNGTVELGNKKNYTSEMEEYTNKMKKGRFCWEVVRKLAKGETIVEDADNKVTKEETEDGKIQRTHVRQVEDVNAKLYKLGLKKNVGVYAVKNLKKIT